VTCDFTESAFGRVPVPHAWEVRCRDVDKSVIRVIELMAGRDNSMTPVRELTSVVVFERALRALRRS
jgi:hypothetical protein